MAEIIKIVIRSESGYGCIDDAYEDSITVKPTGISYHYIPFLESEMNPSCKWSYKAESAAFREKFQHLASVAEEIIPCEEQVIILDAGATDLIVYYSDKTKKVREYFFEDDRADFFLKMLREMIPSFEKMPVLLEEEDEDDDIVREKIEDAQGIADALLNSPRYDFSNLKIDERSMNAKTIPLAPRSIICGKNKKSSAATVQQSFDGAEEQCPVEKIFDGRSRAPRYTHHGSSETIPDR